MKKKDKENLLPAECLGGASPGNSRKEGKFHQRKHRKGDTKKGGVSIAGYLLKTKS